MSKRHNYFSTILPNKSESTFSYAAIPSENNRTMDNSIHKQNDPESQHLSKRNTSSKSDIFDSEDSMDRCETRSSSNSQNSMRYNCFFSVFICVLLIGILICFGLQYMIVSQINDKVNIIDFITINNNLVAFSEDPLKYSMGSEKDFEIRNTVTILNRLMMKANDNLLLTPLIPEFIDNFNHALITTNNTLYSIDSVMPNFVSTIQLFMLNMHHLSARLQLVFGSSMLLTDLNTSTPLTSTPP